ncbi:MAG: cyclic nucleotide-binding domain-containing protein [Acidobacteria bacterium]|nr:cyclic nucleotide-binding domain-containing protein [Acidobacteriota bacterium]
MFKMGEVVIREGELTAAFYLVARGKARVVAKSAGDEQVTVAMLARGDSFGEQSLLFDRPAVATVRAASALVLLAVPAETFRALAEAHPAFRERLEAHIRQYSEFNFLRKLNVLSQLTLKEARALVASIEQVQLQPGEYLFHEGDDAGAAYVVREGQIRILKETANNTLLALLGPGALIGEMSLLHREPRSAAAVAAGNKAVVLLRIDKVAFEQVVHSEKAQRLLIKQASNRLQQQQAFLGDSEEIETGEPAGPATTLKFVQGRIGNGWFARFMGRYPYVQTDHPLLGGVAGLSAIDRFYHQQHDVDALVEYQLAAEQPDDLISLSRKAETWGYLTRLTSLKQQQLDQLRPPVIIQTVEGDLEVLYAVRDEEVVVAHPQRGLEQLPRATFLETWSGQVLLLSYVPSFADVGKDVKSVLRRFLPMVMPYRDLLFWILALSTIVQLTTLAVPLFTKVIIDEVLVHGDRSLLLLMLIGVIVVTMFQLLGRTLTQLLQTYGLRQVGASVVLRFFDHVLSIPYKISSRWRSADFLSRFAENEKLLTMAAQTGFGVLVSTSTAVVYIGALLAQSEKLTAIALLFVGAYAALILVATPRLRSNDRVVYRRKEDLQAFLIELFGGITTIKGHAGESHFQRRGMRSVVDLMQAEFRGARLGFNITLVSNLLSQASTIVVLGLGAKARQLAQLLCGYRLPQLIHRLDTELVAQCDRGARPHARDLEDGYEPVRVLGAEFVERLDMPGIDELTNLLGSGISDAVNGPQFRHVER